jgi:hypothetical protein
MRINSYATFVIYMKLSFTTAIHNFKIKRAINATQTVQMIGLI